MVPLGGESEEEGDCVFPEDTKALQRHLCVCQLSRALGLHHALGTEGKLRVIRDLKAHYHHGLKFGELWAVETGGSSGHSFYSVVQNGVSFYPMASPVIVKKKTWYKQNLTAVYKSFSFRFV